MAVMARVLVAALISLACLVAAQPPSQEQVAADKAAAAADAEEAAEKQDIENTKEAAAKAQAAEASLDKEEEKVATLKSQAEDASKQAEEAADSAQEASDDSKHRVDESAEPTALRALKEQVLRVLNDPHSQKVIAAAALVLGGFAVVQGFHFYQMMVFAIVFAGSYILVLSQANLAFQGRDGFVAKHAAAVLFSSFVVCVAYKGWEGVQLLIGGAFGLYIYSELHGLANSFFPAKVTNDPLTVVAVAGLSVLLGLWMLHEKAGAGRVLGVLCPALGSTLLVSAFGFIFMFAIAHTKKHVPESFPVTPADVPSVLQFWLMIVDPFHSEAVGYFKVQHMKQVGAGSEHVETDRFVCMFLSFVIFFVAARVNLRRDAERRKIHASQQEFTTKFLSKVEQSLARQV